MDGLVPRFLRGVWGGGSGDGARQLEEKPVDESDIQFFGGQAHRAAPRDAPPEDAVRVFLRGVRNGVSLNFSGLSWVKSDKDLELLKTIARVAASYATRDGASVSDLAVYRDATHGADEAFPTAHENECLMYRMVLSLAGNVPVSITTMDAIRSCSTSHVSSVIVGTHIPPGYREPTGSPQEDEEYKLYLSRGSKFVGIVGGHVTTSITVYVKAEAYRRYQQIQSERASASDIPGFPSTVAVGSTGVPRKRKAAKRG